MRVVSLLPSTTEVLFALGAGDDVVGVSEDCDFPPAASTRPVVSRSRLAASGSPAAIDEAVRGATVGGTSLYQLDEPLLRALRPDVIVTQDLCAVCAVDAATVDEAVVALGCDAEVVTVDPATLEDVLDSVERLGRATGRDDAARLLVASLRARLDAVTAAVEGRDRPRVLVLEWTDPPFGAGHWVPDLVTAAGATPLLCRPGARSVPLRWEDVDACGAAHVVVSPCGYHLDDAVHQAAGLLDDPRLPRAASVWAIDADAVVVRPGPRLVDGVEALAAMAHPGALPARQDLVRYVGTTSAKTKPSRSTT